MMRLAALSAENFCTSYPSQILQLTWKSVGGTNASRADNFSSEAPGAFNMHRYPIHSYIFGLSRISRPTFALSNLVQKETRADLAAPPVCHSAESSLVVLYLCRNLDWICKRDGFHIFSEPRQGTAQVFLNFDQLYLLRPWHFFPQISTQKQHWQQERGL